MATDIQVDRHGNEITKRGRCSASGKEYVVTVPPEEWAHWKNDAHPRHCFRSLSAEELRFLVSGQTPLEVVYSKMAQLGRELVS